MTNADPIELEKFAQLAHKWWDPNSEFKPLHDINPLRVDYINRHAGLAGKVVLDVGFGKRHAGRAAIHHAADGRAMRFAKGSNRKKGAESIPRHIYARKIDAQSLPYGHCANAANPGYYKKLRGEF